jgi:hypothetical protein
VLLNGTCKQLFIIAMAIVLALNDINHFRLAVRVMAILAQFSHNTTLHATQILRRLGQVLPNSTPIVAAFEAFGCGIFG